MSHWDRRGFRRIVVVGCLHHFGAIKALPHYGKGHFTAILRGIAVSPAASRRGPPSSWSHWGLRCIRAGASVTFEALGPPPHQGTGLLRSASAGGSASRQEPLSLLSHWGSRRMRAGAFYAVGLPGAPPHEGGGLPCFGAIGAAAASWRGPLSHLGLTGLPPHYGVCLHRFRAIRAPAVSLLRSGIAGSPVALGWGPPSLCSHWGSRLIRAGAFYVVGSPGGMPRQGRGLRHFGAIGAPATSRQGPLLHWVCRGPRCTGQLHEGRGLRRFGAIGVPTASGLGHVLQRDCWAPRRITAEASVALSR